MRPAIQAICEEVAAHFGYVTVEDMLGRSRSKSAVEARALAMWLARLRLRLSYPELGREFSRDHTTCINAVERIESSSGALRVSKEELSQATRDRARFQRPADSRMCQDRHLSCQSDSVCTRARAMLNSFQCAPATSATA